MEPKTFLGNLLSLSLLFVLKQTTSSFFVLFLTFLESFLYRRSCSLIQLENKKQKRLIIHLSKKEYECSGDYKTD